MENSQLFCLRWEKNFQEWGGEGDKGGRGGGGTGVRKLKRKGKGGGGGGKKIMETWRIEPSACIDLEPFAL